MSTVALISARLGSTRLPGKVLLPLCGKPMLWHITQRVRAAAGVQEVVVATTALRGDEAIVACCDAHDLSCYRGSENDVLDRYYRAACRYDAQMIVRVTADCPMVDPALIDEVLRAQKQGNFDLVGAATGAGAVGMVGHHFPDGCDVECYTFAALERLWKTATAPSDREHVSPYAWRNTDEFDVGRVWAPADWGRYRLTVDYAEDYALAKAVYAALWRKERHFTVAEVVAFLEEHPDVYGLNRRWVGQEGYADLWGTLHD